MSEQTRQIGGHNIEVERAGKILFPGDNISKGDLIDYYERIADSMLPHVADRPLTMHRFPDGIDGSDFYQKEAPDYFPDWIRRVTIRVEGTGEDQQQIVADEAATLVYLADQACITPHIWLSRADKLDYPDKLIFDLDPPTDEFQPVRQAALDLRAILHEVNLTSYVMTTGSRGLHVVIPLDRSTDFDTVRDFGHDLADRLAERYPDRLTIAQRKKKRGNRLFLDYLRNAYGQTSVAPYAVRARPGAPVATPLEWDELQRSELTARTYNMDNIFRRLGQKEDPWQDMMRHARSLAAARQQLQEMTD
jgi:bifunctional non-homologous end joining protein LigD